MVQTTEKLKFWAFQIYTYVGGQKIGLFAHFGRFSAWKRPTIANLGIFKRFQAEKRPIWAKTPIFWPPTYVYIRKAQILNFLVVL